VGRRAFTQAEAEFIAAYANEQTPKWIGERLDRDPHAISKWIRLQRPDLWRARVRVLNRRAKRVPEGFKYCRRCERTLPIDDFYPLRRSEPDVRAARCKRCAIETSTQWNLAHKDRFHASGEKSRRKRLYGLLAGDYEALVERQRGLCPICLKPLAGRIHIDHKHGTKQVRGLLHTTCNSGIGMLGDSPEVLQRAIEYLTAS